MHHPECCCPPCSTTHHLQANLHKFGALLQQLRGLAASDDAALAQLGRVEELVASEVGGWVHHGMAGDMPSPPATGSQPACMHAWWPALRSCATDCPLPPLAARQAACHAAACCLLQAGRANLEALWELFRRAVYSSQCEGRILTPGLLADALRALLEPHVARCEALLWLAGPVLGLAVLGAVSTGGGGRGALGCLQRAGACRGSVV